MNGAQLAEKGLSISTVERETGLLKDTLRVWEKRYGFPTPGRDANEERVYSRDQVDKLIIIKRLIDRGARPSKIVSLSMEELLALTESGAARSGDPPELLEFLELVKTHNLAVLRNRLDNALLHQGLERFLQETVAPLNVMVGEAWMRGEFAVFEEHLYTESVQALLRSTVAAHSHPSGTPRVLLTTLPGEQHILGMLMAECMLSTHGAFCIALGPQTPAREIARAAEVQRADVVGLSFSPAYPAHTAIDTLVALRAMLPTGTQLWAGGSNPALFRRRVEGVLAVRELAAIPDAVANWRASRPAT
jgi:DNA-binding transcriptional MerR regulator/methylmalonyl-CoA mutase cobalamin-binding subunit